MQVHPFESETLDFVAEVDDIDLARDLDDDIAEALRRAISVYPVLVVRRQRLSDVDQLRLCRCFGEVAVYSALPVDRTRSDRVPGVARISNLDEHGNLRPPDSRRLRFSKANELWHSDLSSYEVPASISILYALESVPSGEGGETEFANMYTAYQSLPNSRKPPLEALVAYHSTVYSRKRYGFWDFTEEELESAPAVARPLVRIHPLTRRKSLYLSSHIGRFDGMSEDESELLLAELMDIATPADGIYAHTWSPGDVVFWDNQCTMHRARPYNNNHRRVMQRVTALVDTVIPAA